MDNRYNRHNRRKYSLKVHIILVSKYRKQLLKGSISPLQYTTSLSNDNHPYDQR